MTNIAFIFQEKNACHAYEYEREGGDSEESSGYRPTVPHDGMNLIMMKKLFLQRDLMEEFTLILEILLNGKKLCLLF